MVARPRTYLQDQIFYGNHGLVFSDGPLWKEQRRFALHVLRDFGFGRNVMEEKINVDLDRWIEYWDQKVAEAAPARLETQ